MHTDLLVWATKQTGWCSPSSDCDGVHLRMNCPCADPGRFIMLWGPLNNSSETLQHHQRRQHGSNIYIYIFRPSEGTPHDSKTPTSYGMTDVQKSFTHGQRQNKCPSDTLKGNSALNNIKANFPTSWSQMSKMGPLGRNVPVFHFLPQNKAVG